MKHIRYKNVGLTDKAFALDAREKEDRRKGEKDFGMKDI